MKADRLFGIAQLVNKLSQFYVKELKHMQLRIPAD